MAVAKLADDGVAKKVATPVAKPLTPVDIGRPEQLLSVPDDGVPKTGAVKVLLVKVWVPPTVTTLAVFVPAVVILKSPVPMVKIPDEWVRSTFPLL